MGGFKHAGMRPLGNTWGHRAGTWGGFRGLGHGVGLRVKLGDTGLGHGVGLGDKWGHGAGTRGGLRGPAWWNETFGGGHGAGSWGGFREQAGTRGSDMGWV